MRKTEKQLLKEIDDLKKFIDKEGKTRLLMKAKSYLPYLEDDNDFVLNIQNVKAKDLLYIQEGSKENGKYVLEIAIWM